MCICTSVSGDGYKITRFHARVRFLCPCKEWSYFEGDCEKVINVIHDLTLGSYCETDDHLAFLWLFLENVIVYSWALLKDILCRGNFNSRCSRIVCQSKCGCYALCFSSGSVFSAFCFAGDWPKKMWSRLVVRWGS